MRKLLEQILRYFASAILKKYKPKIIGITGSVGKTTTKEAVFAVLSPHFKVRKSEKSYNNELGLPLTIIGAEAGGKSPIRWLGVFLKAIWLLINPLSLSLFSRSENRGRKSGGYPEILILEMAADKPGDIKYFLRFVKCDIGVVTAVGPAHLEQFKELDKIVKEKSRVVSELGQNGVAILNFDDENVREMRQTTKAKVITFGFSAPSPRWAQQGGSASGGGESADLKCVEFIPGSVIFEESQLKTDGVSFKLVSNGKAVPVHLPNVLGRQQIYAALAAAAVGIVFDLNLIEIAESLSRYKSPPGRMNIIAGVKNTILIDDSYNASPRSVLAALEVLSFLPAIAGARKFAALGDMRELGDYTEKAHREIGKAVVEDNINYLVTAGSDASTIGKEAEKRGMSMDNIFSFDFAEDAGRFLQDRIKQGDIILIKGSRAMQMEKIVRELMAEPLKAEELLIH